MINESYAWIPTICLTFLLSDRPAIWSGWSGRLNNTGKPGVYIKGMADRSVLQKSTVRLLVEGPNPGDLGIINGRQKNTVKWKVLPITSFFSFLVDLALPALPVRNYRIIWG